jgi:phage FluMu protein Com
MLITCSACKKKLKVADTMSGKKVRCPHCKSVTLAPKIDEAAEETATESAAPTKGNGAITEKAPSASKKKKPIPADDDEESATPKKKPPRAKSRSDEDEDDAHKEEAPTDRMCCPKCSSAALAELPPNQFTRRPGFVCKKCGQKMRQPGSTVLYTIGIVLGVLGVLGGIALSISVLFMEPIRVRAAVGGVALVVICISVIGFSFSQMRLPVPKNAPPVRWLLWICVTLAMLFVLSLFVGGCLFGFAYFLQEML